jgi:phosphatidylglycerophosphate synthase
LSASGRHGPPGPFVLNLPNAFTASRLVLVAPFAWLLFTGAPRWTLVATFAFAAATDLFDGQLARRLGQVTPGGAWLDQMVDRVFTVAIVAVVVVHDLGFATPPDRLRPALLGLACTREGVGALGVAIALARGVPLYFVEPIGKLTTFVQSTAIAVILLGPAFASWLAIACGVIGVFSGASYVRHALRATPAAPAVTAGRSDA